MGKRKEDEAALCSEPGSEQKVRSLRTKRRRAWSEQECNEAQQVHPWIGELMRLANIDSNKQHGAQRYKEQKELVLGLVPAQWHEAVKKLPFKANTSSIHAKAADKIIEAVLKGDAAVPPVAAPPPAAPPASVLPTPARKRATKRQRQGASQNLLDRYFGSAVTEVAEVADDKRNDDAPEMGREADEKSPSVDHYAILGIQKDASTSEVHAAYKKRALDSHPDKPGGSNEAFLKVRDAFEVLSRKFTRERYDATNSAATAGPATVPRRYEAATVGASKTSDLCKNIVALLLLKRLDKEILGTIDRKVLRSVEEVLRQIRTSQNTNASGVTPQKDGSGLRREKNGDWTVSISWNSFRMEALKIKDLGVATALHSALVKAREVALERIEKHKTRFSSRSAEKMEEEPPLTESELHQILEEQPYMILMASDSRRKWDSDDVEDLPKEDRWMSPWTPSLETALRFRRQIRFELGKTNNMGFRKEDKTQQSEIAAQERDAFMNLVEELWRMACLKLASNPPDDVRLALEVSDAASSCLKREMLWKASSKLKSEKIAKLQQQEMSMKEDMLALEDHKHMLEDQNQMLQEKVERTARLFNQMKREQEAKDKILKAGKNVKEKLLDLKKARDIAASLGRQDG